MIAIPNRYKLFIENKILLFASASDYLYRSRDFAVSTRDD